MEKLIELLTEYEPRIAGDGEHYDNIWWYRHFMSDKTVANNATRYIVSKEYGFIKRLVEKDKIDIDAYKTVYSGDLDKRKTLIMSSGGDEFYQVTEHGVYESLLMLLAIQDEPIEFLISLLK